MKRQSIRYALLAVAFAIAPGLATAGPLEGIYTIEFDGPFSIWEVGDVEECDTTSEPGISLTACVDMTFDRDSRGRIFGSGDMTFSGSVEGASVSGTLTGSISGKEDGRDNRDTKVTLKFKFSGLISIAGQSLQTKVTGKLNGMIDSAGVFNGSLREKVCIKGARCETVTVAFSDVASGGPWTLELDLANNGGKITGTATASLHGVTRDLTAKGKYNSKKDISKVGTKGIGSSRGISIKFKNVDSPSAGLIAGGSVKYKVDGYKGRVRDLAAGP